MRHLNASASPGHELLRWGTRTLRATTWQGRADTASVVPLPHAGALPVDAVLRWKDDLRALGFSHVVTSAMAPADAEAFLAAGFAVREHLRLLGRDLEDLPPRPHRTTLRRGRRADWEAILHTDADAFAPDWRFDATALADALAATPSSRLRVTGSPDSDPDPGAAIAGYAVSGRSMAYGYLQRLAVRSEVRRQGVATALVADGLRWMRRRGARRVLVNTQVSNEGALALYGHLGFRPEPDDLAVLIADLRGER